MGGCGTVGGYGIVGEWESGRVRECGRVGW